MYDDRVWFYESAIVLFKGGIAERGEGRWGPQNDLKLYEEGSSLNSAVANETITGSH